MTDQQPLNPAGPSRRSLLLGGGAALGALPLLSACTQPTQAEPTQTAAATQASSTSAAKVSQDARLVWVQAARHQNDTRPTGTHLITLGVSGGPGWYPTSEHCGIGTAIVVGGRTYLVDVGDRVPEQYMRANPNQQQDYEEFSTLAGVFLTHLHSDHSIDYFKLFNYAWWHGIGKVPDPIVVRGPGRRKTLTPALDQAQTPAPFNPRNPMPGTVDMTESLFAGYATDINDRQRDNGLPVLRDLLDVQDIKIPGATTQWESVQQMPAMDPFTVHEDDRVKVTAITVNHYPIYPALAFRFDTDDGSIVISGDTGPTPNLITLAKEADVLVHEVIDDAWIDTVYADQEGIAQHLRKAHTPASQLGAIAEESGVGTLVLHHLVPSEPPLDRFLPARDGFSGDFHIATELDVIPLRQP